MGILDIFTGKGGIKAQKAYRAHGEGKYEEALRLYEEAEKEGMDQPKFLLGYSVLLIRNGQYEKARKILVQMQKNPQMTPEQRAQLFVNYSACVFRMGELEKGISLLERQHAHAPSGTVYQTLGYLYVEKFDQANKPVFEDKELPPEEDGEPAEGEEAPAPRILTAAEQEAEWQAALEKAAAFEAEAVDYDDEDAVCLDNMAQFLYRVRGVREGARAWFDKALSFKEGQIDTLWFLSRYDLEEGNTAKAVERLEKAVQGRFSPLNYVNRGIIEAELKRLKG